MISTEPPEIEVLEQTLSLLQIYHNNNNRRMLGTFRNPCRSVDEWCQECAYRIANGFGTQPMLAMDAMSEMPTGANVSDLYINIVYFKRVICF